MTSLIDLKSRGSPEVEICGCTAIVISPRYLLLVIRKDRGIFGCHSHDETREGDQQKVDNRVEMLDDSIRRDR